MRHSATLKESAGPPAPAENTLPGNTLRVLRRKLGEYVKRMRAFLREPFGEYGQGGAAPVVSPRQTKVAKSTQARCGSALLV